MCVCVCVCEREREREGMRCLCKFKQLILQSTLHQCFHGKRLVIEKLIIDELTIDREGEKNNSTKVSIIAWQQHKKQKLSKM